MKRILRAFAVILAVLMLIMSLTGCDIGGKAKPTEAAKNTPDPDVTPAPTQAPPDIDPSTVDYIVPEWNATELTFISTVEYTKPFYDVKLDVTFTAPNGTTLVMPGFWDGELTWKVRFAPTMYGVWSYKTTCSDAANAGLNGKEGKIGANAYKGDLEIYKHGFLRISENKRYFTYADGTPFFYLGDTHWGLPFEQFEGSNVEGIASQFKYMVDKRVSQGFTVFQSEPLGGNTKGDKPLALRKFDKNSLPGFTNLDRKFKYIAEKGMVHANAQFFFVAELANYNIKNYPDEYLDALSRYWVARYAAYPVMWTTAQEVDNDYYFESSKNCFNAEENPWKKVAAAMHKYDPYSHPLTGHMEEANMRPDRGANATKSTFKYIDGHNWYAPSWSPNPKVRPDFSIPKDFWNSEIRKPTVNYEGHYDHFWTNTMGARMQGWTAYLNGMFGQGYGAAGVWLTINDYAKKDLAGDYDLDKDTGTDPETAKEAKRMNWYEGLQLPAAEQLSKHMKSFLQSFEWWKLEPCFDDPNATRIFIPSAWYAASTIGNQTYVVYFYNTSPNTGFLCGLEQGKTYTAKWYNPRTGEYTEISSAISGSVDKSNWKMPDKPDSQDWVIYVKINK